jgi:hypothetical protein
MHRHLPPLLRRGIAGGAPACSGVASGGAAIAFAQGAPAVLGLRRVGEPALATAGLVALVVIVPVVAAIVLVALAAFARGMLRRRRRSSAELRASSRLEERARAMMSELCPSGWRASITLCGDGAAAPDDAPAGERSRVCLDWSEMRDEQTPAVTRRVWAPTLAEALEAMVMDRRTDETLEAIERTVSTWPE